MKNPKPEILKKYKSIDDYIDNATREDKYGPSLSAEEIKTLRKETRAEYAAFRDAVYSGLGKYGEMAIDYIFSDDYPDFTAVFAEPSELNAYGKKVDRAAEKLSDTLEKQLRALPENALNGEFLHDLQINRGIEAQIEEHILAEIVYVPNFVSSSAKK